MRGNRKKYQSGQAIAELLASIVALSAAFVGILFIASLGMANIDNLLKAKTNADGLAISDDMTSASHEGQALIGWSTGNDELYFTADDSPIGGGDEDGAYFLSQMRSTSPAYDLTGGVTINGSTYASPFVNLETNLFFLNAAALVAGSSTDSDPLSKRGLEDLVSAFESLLFVDPNISLTEAVYMPQLGSN